MKRGESEVARTIRDRLCTRFRRGKIFFTELATVFRYGGLRESKKRRKIPDRGENFKVNRACDCRSGINWWKASNVILWSLAELRRTKRRWKAVGRGNVLARAERRRD